MGALLDRDPPHIFEVSPLQIMGLWEELMKCIYDKNSYGGTIAEIYLFRVMPFSVFAANSPNSEMAQQEYSNANKNLHDLCRIFEKRQGVKLYIFEGDKILPLSALLGKDGVWTHRIHIGVKKVKK